MLRRALILLILGLGSIALTSCHHARVQNPLAGLDSKQPDKVLFDRAMEAMKKGKYEVSRTVLQTLINTYPDSEYIARAKLAVGDSWYAEAGTTGLAQAEIEYKDFITFFPNVPEAAEAQLKVANIHYRQMEKPDRDFTHARRAEEEYRSLILQFPDSKLVPEAKQKLRQVQEVLAEREFRIGRFYYLRQSYPAAIARLKTLTDSYPLYSQADEALYMLGSAFESEIDIVRRAKGVEEVKKAVTIQDFTNNAADAYTKLVSRYPVMPRSEDAKKRLQVLNRPVPTPSAEAIAQNRAEEQSRGETGAMGKVMGNFRRAPDVSQTAKVGEPNLTGTKDASAPEFLKQVQRSMMGKAANEEPGTVSVETVGKGSPPPNQAVPRSEQGNPEQPSASEQGAKEQQSGSAQRANEQQSGSSQGANEQQSASDQADTQQQKSSEQVDTQGQQSSPEQTGIPEIQPLEQSPAQAAPQPAAPPQAAPAAPPQTAPESTTPQSSPETASPQTSSGSSAPLPPKQVNDAQVPAPQTESEQANQSQAGTQEKSAERGSATTDSGKKTSSSSKKKKKKTPPQS